MRKLLFAVLLFGTLSASAKFYLSGTVGVAYQYETFSAALKPDLGYELNDRWALGACLGAGVNDGDGYGILAPYGRYTCWNNGKVFLDLKAKAAFAFSSDETVSEFGLVPAVRFRISRHWDVGADVGLLGVDVSDGETDFVFGVTSLSCGLNVTYRF